MREQTVHVAESQVMGRHAVAVVAALATPTAIGQLTGTAQGSESLDGLGVPYLATVWAASILLAGLFMAASYLAHREDDTRVLEIGAAALLAAVAGVHAIAVLNEIGWSGGSWVISIDAALFINCGGRALFLARQIWWVARTTKAAR